jgi:hypothetical protein
VLSIEKDYQLALKPCSGLEEARGASGAEEEKKQKKRAPKRSAYDSSEEGDSDEDDDDEEDGQIQIPKDVVQRINDLQPEEFYLVVYVGRKTEKEINQEQQVGYSIHINYQLMIKIRL